MIKLTKIVDGKELKFYIWPYKIRSIEEQETGSANNTRVSCTDGTTWYTNIKPAAVAKMTKVAQ